MWGMKWIITILALVIVLALYFFVIQLLENSGGAIFQGPTEAPSVEGPGGPR